MVLVRFLAGRLRPWRQLRVPFGSVGITVAVALLASGLPITPAVRAADDGTVERSLYPPADGTQPAGPLPSLNVAEAHVVKRTETTTVYARPDRWHEAVISPVPVNWRDPASGNWSAIDTRLVPDGSGGFRNASGPFSVSFAGRTGSGHLMRLAGEDWELGFSPDGAAAGQPARVDGSSVKYQDIFPGVDLEYLVGPGSVKEVFVVKRPVPPALLARLRFGVDLAGLRARPADGGGVVLVNGQDQEMLRLPPGSMTDAAGRSGTVGVELAQEAGGPTVDVVPDSGFARKTISYPWRIDPSVILAGAPGFDAYASSANPATNYDGASQWDGARHVDKAGFEACWGCEEFYSYQQFDLAAVKDKEIIAATWDGFAASTRGTGRFTLWAAGDPWTAGSITWASRPAHRTDAGARKDGTAAAMQWASTDVTDWVRNWLDPTGWPNHGIAINTAGEDSFVKFGAMEGPGNVPQIRVTFNPGPSVSTSTPFGGSETITTTTPALAGSSVAGAQYAFRIGTSPDVDSAPVITSTLLGSPSWTVPAGVLRDGGVYYRKVYTYAAGTWASGIPRRFVVNRRLGDQAVSPTDPVGPVSVNLATGNVAYQHSSPTFQTTGGLIGASFAYNSQATSNYGLSGAYTANCDGSQPWTKARPTARRHDTGNGATWSLSFPGAPIPGSVDSNTFCARWSGYLTVPYAATGSSYYSFGLAHDDGAKIFLDNSPVPYLVGNGVGTDWGGQLQFQASQTVPIAIELVDAGGPASVALQVSGAENGPVPLSWLSPTPPVLPTGWSSSLGASAALSYTSAVIERGGEMVTLLGPGGEPSMFEADSSRQAWHPVNGDPATISKSPSGDMVVGGADGMTYVFDPRGKLRSATAGPDRTNLAAPTFEYDSSGRLVRVREARSNLQRYMELVYYSGPGTCPAKSGFDSVPPSGHLCRINYTWDSTSTRLYYQAGRLASIEDPGDATAGASDGPQEVRFAYDANGRMVSVRDGLASDYANRLLRPDNDLLRTVIAYTGEKAASVTLPEPMPGQARPAHSYRYVSPTETQVDVAGLGQPHGFFRKVAFTVGGQTTADTDATNLTTRYVWDWNPTDQPLWKIDPNGLKTGYVHDAAGRLQFTHGPAPESCFYDEFNTIGSWCSSTAPVSSTHYDTIAGLGATYWSGPVEFGGDDGRPDGEELAFNAPSTTMTKTWTATAAPPGVTGGRWSGRFTGLIGVSGPDTITFRLDHHSGDKARLFINDTLVVDRWSGSGPNQAEFGLAEGQHRIRIDYVNTGTSVPGGSDDASVTLSWFDVGEPG